MTFSFHPEANEELWNALEYYETCERGLGEEFYLEVQTTIDRILNFPQTWPMLEAEVRRCLVHRSRTESCMAWSPTGSSSLP